MGRATPWACPRVDGMSRPSIRAGIEAALHGAGLPYGYTVTIWSTGAVLIESHGNPGAGFVFLFAGGASAAYGLLKMLSRGAGGEMSRRMSASPNTLRAGLIHFSAILLAIAGADLVALVHDWVAWALGSFVATFVYLAVSGLELMLQHRELQPEAKDRATAG